MKKTVKVLALMLVLILSSAMLLSCGATPNADYKAAKAALEEAGYRADISSSVFGGVDGIEHVVKARGGAGMNIKNLTICYFESKEAADAAWEPMQTYIETAKESSWSPDTFVARKADNMIFYGNEELIEAAQ